MVAEVMLAGRVKICGVFFFRVQRQKKHPESRQPEDTLLLLNSFGDR